MNCVIGSFIRTLTYRLLAKHSRFVDMLCSTIPIVFDLSDLEPLLFTQNGGPWGKLNPHYLSAKQEYYRCTTRPWKMVDCLGFEPSPAGLRPGMLHVTLTIRKWWTRAELNRRPQKLKESFIHMFGPFN